MTLIISKNIFFFFPVRTIINNELFCKKKIGLRNCVGFVGKYSSLVYLKIIYTLSFSFVYDIYKNCISYFLVKMLILYLLVNLKKKKNEKENLFDELLCLCKVKCKTMWLKGVCVLYDTESNTKW